LSGLSRSSIHFHRWEEGDLLLWDNRCVMYRARPFDLPRHGRDMRRVRPMDTTDVG
jgi:alpha-ketoglutarate-dependent taurine dioxygenase